MRILIIAAVLLRLSAVFSEAREFSLCAVTRGVWSSGSATITYLGVVHTDSHGDSHKIEVSVTNVVADVTGDAKHVVELPPFDAHLVSEGRGGKVVVEVASPEELEVQAMGAACMFAVNIAGRMVLPFIQSDSGSLGSVLSASSNGVLECELILPDTVDVVGVGSFAGKDLLRSRCQSGKLAVIPMVKEGRQTGVQIGVAELVQGRYATDIRLVRSGEWMPSYSYVATISIRNDDGVSVSSLFDSVVPPGYVTYYNSREISLEEVALDAGGGASGEVQK